MKVSTSILLILVAAIGLSFTTFDDRGGKKSSKKVLLNISNTVAMKNSIFSQNFTSVQYKGLSFGSTSSNSTTVIATTFQKGNTIYIQPNKQKILVPEFKQGYGGLKLIINVL